MTRICESGLKSLLSPNIDSNVAEADTVCFGLPVAVQILSVPPALKTVPITARSKAVGTSSTNLNIMLVLNKSMMPSPTVSMMAAICLNDSTGLPRMSFQITMRPAIAMAITMNSM